MQTDQVAEGPRTVLVTGGSGFLGGWCVLELLRRGYVVRTSLRDPTREPRVRAMLGAETDTGDRLGVVQADLTRDDGWDAAVDGCDYVLHVASPFPARPSRNRDELVGPARDGTLRVLRASLSAGVRRVVVTSSVTAAVYGKRPPPDPVTETHWTDLAHPQAGGAYVRSKTLAERSAWELMREQDAVSRLAVVAPGTMLGPVLGSDLSYSLQTVSRMLDGTMPGIPRLGFTFVDVRDVADLHIRAMTAPQAAGERFFATGEFRWLIEVARVLRDRLGPDAARVPVRRLPNLLVRGIALFDPALRRVVGDLGQRINISASKAATVLGWSSRPIEESITDCANSLIRTGAVGRAEPVGTR